MNIVYAEQGGKASWIASPVARLPDAMRKAANFSAAPQDGVGYGYGAPAGAAALDVLAAELDAGPRTALMCLEADHLVCNRHVLTEALRARRPKLRVVDL